MKSTLSYNRNKLATIASYQLCLLRGEKGTDHTVAEENILPVAKIISDALFSEKCTKMIDDVPLSDTTVKKRIDGKADGVKEAL